MVIWVNSRKRCLVRSLGRLVRCQVGVAPVAPPSALSSTPPACSADPLVRSSRRPFCFVLFLVPGSPLSSPGPALGPVIAGRNLTPAPVAMLRRRARPADHASVGMSQAKPATGGRGCPESVKSGSPGVSNGSPVTGPFLVGPVPRAAFCGRRRTLLAALAPHARCPRPFLPPAPFPPVSHLNRRHAVSLPMSREAA